MEQRDAIRAVMILNEIEVDIARQIKFDEPFYAFQERISEVKQLILTQTFPYNEKQISTQSPQNEGC